MKRFIIAGTAAVALALPASALAAPTSGPEAGPGCFGQWRAGSIQDLTAGGFTVGKDFFSMRAGTNSTINAQDRATCAALS